MEILVVGISGLFATTMEIRTSLSGLMVDFCFKRMGGETTVAQ